MNASELKIGDWVLFHGEKGTVCSIDPPSIFVKINDNIWRTKQSSGNLAPIPLTEEILKKNGWESSTTDWDWQLKFHSATLHAYFYYYGRGLNHELDSDEMKKLVCAISVTCNQDCVSLHEIHYVHELQHILWALGIDDNIKL